MADQGGLTKYNAKRDFSKTAEPEGKVAKTGGNRYLIQKHAATRLHYDFRLELDGVLKSWAVTRGPSFNPGDKRLAVQTEDHPVDYGDFEGTIPKGEYGGGTVMLWDQGTWEPVGDPHEGLEKGDLKFRLHGERLSGEWVLARMRSRPEDRGRSNWLLIKHRDDVSNEDDAEAWLETQGTSIVSGRSMDEIAQGDNAWHANRAEEKKPKAAGSKKKPASSSRARSGQVSFIEPELATLADAMPSGSTWVHELKFDGYRVQVLIDTDGVRLLTRKGLDWSHRFPPLPRLFDRLDVQSAIIDGEIVAANPDGSHSFKTLQAVLGEEKSDAPLQYYAFDLLHLNGEDLTGQPLTDRKSRLQALLQGKDFDGRIIYSEHFSDRDDAFLHQVCGIGMEGLISKRADAPYTRGRGKSWLKTKCHKRQEFVIGGFTEPTHAHRGVGALLLGYYEKGEFIYAGKCGTGFNLDNSQDLRRRLDTLALEKSKTGAFAAVPPEVRREAHYVTPKLICEIEFTEWTPDGRLRHPSFQGLREDKPAKEVGRDKPLHTETIENQPLTGKSVVTIKKSKGADVGGIVITHPDRIVYPDDGVTKQDVAEYYHAIANHILPHIVNRPISMIRCPEGIGDQCFFQRHLGQGQIEHVHDTGITVNGRNEEYVMIDDIHGLISLAQWGVMEIHPWGCKAYEPDLPDRMIFDLDPDPEATWKDVTDGAAEVRARMKEFGLKSFLKTTGGKGLHVVVPIKPRFHWDAIKAFTRAVAQSMAHDNPKRYIATASKSARKGRVFIDYLRNDHTATAVAAYSLRARPGAPVAMPVEWDELGAGLKPSEFNIRTAVDVLKGRKHDPWAEVFKIRQAMPAKVLEALKIPAE